MKFLAIAAAAVLSLQAAADAPPTLEASEQIPASLAADMPEGANVIIYRYYAEPTVWAATVKIDGKKLAKTKTATNFFRALADPRDIAQITVSHPGTDTFGWGLVIVGRAMTSELAVDTSPAIATTSTARPAWRSTARRPCRASTWPISCSRSGHRIN